MFLIIRKLEQFEIQKKFCKSAMFLNTPRSILMTLSKISSFLKVYLNNFIHLEVISWFKYIDWIQFVSSIP